MYGLTELQPIRFRIRGPDEIILGVSGLMCDPDHFLFSRSYAMLRSSRIYRASPCEPPKMSNLIGGDGHCAVSYVEELLPHRIPGDNALIPKIGFGSSKV